MTRVSNDVIILISKSSISRRLKVVAYNNLTRRMPLTPIDFDHVPVIHQENETDHLMMYNKQSKSPFKSSSSTVLLQ